MIYLILFFGHFLSTVGILFFVKRTHFLIFISVGIILFLYGIIAANCIVADATTVNNLNLKFVGYALYGFYSALGGVMLNVMFSKIPESRTK